jgi:hypothetical protein
MSSCIQADSEGHNVGMPSFPPRPLTFRERSVLEKLLAADFAGAEHLREQVDTTLVVGRCDCGCPTIDLRVAAGAPPADVARSPVPSELRDTSVDPPSDVILFVKDGYLQSMEYVSYTSNQPQDWPDVEALQPA